MLAVSSFERTFMIGWCSLPKRHPDTEPQAQGLRTKAVEIWSPSVSESPSKPKKPGWRANARLGNSSPTKCRSSSGWGGGGLCWRWRTSLFFSFFRDACHTGKVGFSEGLAPWLGRAPGLLWFSKTMDKDMAAEADVERDKAVHVEINAWRLYSWVG